MTPSRRLLKLLLQLLMPTTKKKLTNLDKKCNSKLLLEKSKRNLTKLRVKNMLQNLRLLMLRLKLRKFQLLAKLCKKPLHLKHLK
jgi:hypothetical protein